MQTGRWNYETDQAIGVPPQAKDDPVTSGAGYRLTSDLNFREGGFRHNRRGYLCP